MGADAIMCDWSGMELAEQHRRVSGDSRCYCKGGCKGGAAPVKAPQDIALLAQRLGEAEELSRKANTEYLYAQEKQRKAQLYVAQVSQALELAVAALVAEGRKP
jgi:hypothetical protein